MSRIVPTLAAVAVVAFVTLHNAAIAEEGMQSLAWLDEPEPAPDVLFTIENGETQTLEDYRGKVIVLNFWAIWCPPCRDEMPSLAGLQAELGGEHFLVMAMSQDRGGEEDILEFYDKVDVTNLGVFSDPTQKVARDFRVRGLPTTYIIDHHGNQVAKLVGGATWDNETALNELRPLVERAAADAGSSMSEQASNDIAP
jgi:thiol-disulfide isomerase/thioredoxin